jgi:hypothetical protein
MDDQRTDREGGQHVARKRRLWLVAVLVTAALTAVAVTAFLWWPVDGISGYLYFRNHPDQTVLAEGYSDTGFRKVYRGMTRLKVIELLGPPLESKDELYCRCGTIATQSWSRGQDNSAYRRRTIEYVDDIVVQRLSGVVDPTQE